MSQNCYCRVAQKQMQDVLKDNPFEWPFWFDIQHKFPTHPQSSLKIHDTMSVSSSYFGIKCCRLKL